jgi:hypothetical protein
MRIATSAWLVVCLALTGVAASLSPAAAEPERFTFELREMTAKQKIEEICRIAGLQFQPDAEATRKLAASTVRVSSVVRDVPVAPMLSIVLSDLAPDQAGLQWEINEPVARLVQRPVNSMTLEIALDNPKLPASLEAGALRLDVNYLNLDPKHLSVRLTCNEPKEIRWLCNGYRAGWEPRVRLKSGKQSVIFGRSERHKQELWIDGPVLGATPEDPPVALVWDIRWWKP